LTVVIADDDAAFREALRLVLEADGDVVVGEARDGSEAVQLAGMLHPDVLLLDYEMPILDGIAAAQIVVRRWPEISVVFLSGTADAEARRRALAAGAASYIDKSELADVARLIHQEAMAQPH
jgi:DNA-binding NarL/FixJ family response regulator